MNKKNIIIFGKNGQVAMNLLRLFDLNWYSVAAYSSSEVDFTKLVQLQSFLQTITPPDFIINAAAYTNVDKAEEEKEMCDLINHQAIKIIANYCAKNAVKLISYSTDYVFDGSGNQPFSEDNVKNLNPLNFYGKSKLDGERAIMASNCDYVILRTSWVYNDVGKNFVNTITKLAQEKEELNIVDDQIGAPTSAEYIAKSTIKIIKTLQQNHDKNLYGIYHLTGKKYISWYQFALEIIDNLKKNSPASLRVKKVNPIKTKDYNYKAIRPLNSRLNCDKVQKVFEV